MSATRWSELSRPAPPHGRSSPARPGAPGLWRELDGRIVFDLPPARTGFTPAAWEAWAEAAAQGALPEGWRAPDQQDLERCGLRPERLIAQAGPHLALAEVLREEQRLALRHVGLGAASPPPSAARAAWLEALLDDAAQHWRLVRIGRVDGRLDRREDRLPLLEVDLSGAPPADLPALLPFALDALRMVAEWLLPPLHLLLDPCVAPAALARPPARPRAAERHYS